MKTIILSVGLILMFIISTNAQNKFSIVIEGAALATGLINQNPYELDKLPVSKTKGGFKAITIDYKLNANLSLQSGVQLLNTGQNYLNKIDEHNFNNRKIDLDYVVIPLIIQNQLGKGGLKFIAGAGISYSRLIDSKFEENIDTSFGNGDATLIRKFEVDSDRFNKNQVSTNAFTGFLLTLNERVHVKATVLGNLGLSDINSLDYQYEDSWEVPYKKTKTVAAGASLGLQFKL